MQFNWNDTQRSLVAAAVVAVAVLVAAFFGFDLHATITPIPAPVALATATPSAGGGINVETVQPALTYKALIVQNDLVVSDVRASDTITSSAGLTVTSGSLGIGADSFSGPIRYSRFTNVANNGLITYSLSTTPTVVLCWAGSIYTPSVILSSLTPVTATIATSSTVPTLYCAAGR